MTDVSALGFSVIITDTKLFPVGFVCKQFADDADPFDFPDLDVGETTMDANGNMVYSATPSPIEFTLNLLPNTPEAENMAAIFDGARAVKGRPRTAGKLTMVVNYNDGSKKVLTGVRITSGTPAKAIQQAGRYKSLSYSFAAADMVG